MTNDHQLLTVREAGDLMRVSRQSVYRLTVRGVIPSLKVGGARRIPLKALLDYISAQTRKEMARIRDDS